MIRVRGVQDSSELLKIYILEIIRFLKALSKMTGDL